MKENQPYNPLGFAAQAVSKVTNLPHTFFANFINFIKEYGVVALAIGVVIGSAVGKFVNAIVDDIVTPLINMLLTVDLNSWQWGQVKIGSFLSSFIEFVLVLIIIFFSVKYVLNFFRLVESDKEKLEQKELKDLKKGVKENKESRSKEK